MNPEARPAIDGLGERVWQMLVMSSDKIARDLGMPPHHQPCKVIRNQAMPISRPAPRIATGAHLLIQNAVGLIASAATISELATSSA